MTEHARTASAQAARQVGDIAELLDVLWEQARSDSPAPNVPASQLRVMYLVDREDGLRMRALVELLGAAPPSASRLVDRLQALGFVRRDPCPDSGREVLLSLTAEGRRYLARIREERDDLLMRTLATMPARQRTTLTRSLAAFQEALTGRPDPRLLPPETPPAPAPEAQDVARSA
ncbi:MarR family transcriptional regulator [Streptomyces sp. NPDC046853]|uniref:MarR family winged helix-turn-helix transcriptional regulator n=1 Tax=Streptomyces sp. NPDC046853 TaxID=3154920 RepID=UPI0033ECECA3